MFLTSDARCASGSLETRSRTSPTKGGTPCGEGSFRKRRSALAGGDEVLALPAARDCTPAQLCVCSVQVLPSQYLNLSRLSGSGYQAAGGMGISTGGVLDRNGSSGRPQSRMKPPITAGQIQRNVTRPAPPPGIARRNTTMRSSDGTRRDAPTPTSSHPAPATPDIRVEPGVRWCGTKGSHWAWAWSGVGWWGSCGTRLSSSTGMVRTGIVRTDEGRPGTCERSSPWRPELLRPRGCPEWDRP